MPAYRPTLPLRPGERREPIIDLRVERQFATAAASRGLTLGTAVELTLERALVIADLESLNRSDLFNSLLGNAKQQRFIAPLPGPYRRYRASLLQTEPRELDEDELDEPKVVPLRFFPRVLEINYAEALTADAIDEGRTLELAALCAGRTMSEYALRFACVATNR